MPQEWLHTLLYAFLSGVTYFLPVSTAAHQQLYCRMFGFEDVTPLLIFAIRLGGLIAALVGCGGRLKRLLRQYRLGKRSNRRRRYVDTGAILDIRLLKTAMLPALLSVLLYKRADGFFCTLPRLALALLAGGLVLFWPRLRSQGNKDGRSASRLDSMAMGLGTALGAIPGFSRVGGTVSLGMVRGVERNYALEVAFLLSIPTLLGLSLLDLYGVFAAKTVLTGVTMLWALLAAAVSFLGGYLSMILLRHASMASGLSGWSYYSWGMALLAFTLFLTI